MLYLWLKAAHIMAVIAWMAGLFYLPRLFAYHADQTQGSATVETFKVMERRLLVFIMRPAGFLAIMLGGGLLSTPGVVNWHMGWIWVKLALVLVLLALHGACERWQRQFAEGKNRHSSRFFRIVNEVPTLAMLIIVAMVVVKPF